MIIIIKNSDSKIYIFSYIISIFIVCFNDSQLFNPSNTNILVKLFMNSMMFGVILCNIFLFFNNDRLNLLDRLMVIIIIFAGIISVMFNLKLMSPTLLMIYLTIFNASLVTPYKLSKIDFKYRMSFVGCIIILSLLGVFPKSSPAIRNGHIRYIFGFLNPNGLATASLACIFSFVIFIELSKELKKSIKLVIYILIIIAIFCIYILTVTRGAVISLTLLLILLLCKNRTSFIYKHLILFTSIPLVVTCYLILVLQTNSSTFDMLDVLSSSRMSKLHNVISLYPVNIVGYKSTPLLNVFQSNANGSISTGTIAVDNLYIDLLLISGVIGLSIFLFILFSSVNISKKLDNRVLGAIIISLSVFVLTESATSIYLPFAFAISLYANSKYNYKIKKAS